MTKDEARLEKFGKMLTLWLELEGMTQAQLARAVGTTQSTVSAWAGGRHEPSAMTVFALEKALGRSPGSLSCALGYAPVEAASPEYLRILEREQEMVRVLVDAGITVPVGP